MGNADLLSILDLVADLDRLAGGVHELDIGNVDTCLLFYNSALGVLGVGFGMFGHHIDTLDDDAVLVAKHLENLSGLAFIVTGVAVNDIAFLDV